MKKIFLVDGMAILYRAHYAMINNPLRTESGVYTSAIFGFFNTMFKIFKEEEPDYFLITMDTKKPTFRHKRYAEYKANRKEMPIELQEQIPIFYDILNKSNINVVRADGFEADDVLGTIVTLNNNSDLKQYIVSADKDLMQLVNKNTFVFSPGNNFQPKKIYTEKAVLDKWGVDCNRIIDYLALVGDSSDNIPGVAGVGPKTAVKLLNQFDTVENIYNSINDIKNDRLKERMISNKDNAFLSKELVTIDTSVPVNFSIDDVAFDLIDFNNMQIGFNELEIYTFDTIINKYINKKPRENKKIKKDYNLIQNQKDLIDLSEEIKNYEYFSIDLETTDINPNIAQIVGISLSFNRNQAYYIPFLSPNNNVLSLDLFIDLFSSVLRSKKYKIIGQNIKYDLLVLKRHGIKIENIYFDTMIAESLISPEKSSYKLDNLSLDYLEYQMQPIEELIGDKKNTQILMSEVALDKVCFYACEDADITLQIFYKQSQLIKDMELDNLFYNIEIPLISVLLNVEYNGIFIDEIYIQKLSAELKVKIATLSKSIYSMADKEFNINSPKQLSEVLFDELELKPIKKRSTASNVLEKLKDFHPIAQYILDYRHLSKLVNTYLDTMPNFIIKNTNRIHTSFNQAITSTGRLSSTKPNFQNIPIKTDIGKKIRKAFIPENKNNFIYSFDYSQIELRILAHYSSEKNLINSFINDDDIHTRTAALIFEMNESDVGFDERRIAKTINYSIIYGAGPYRISQELKIPIKEAASIIDNYFNTYPKIKEYIDNTVSVGLEDNIVRTFNGRLRKTLNLKSSNRNIVEAEKRAIINMPIQGTASELIKIAMINIDKKIQQDQMKSKMILQIHDELLFEVPEDELDAIRTLVIYEMENAMDLDVPIKVDSNYGKNWYEAH